MSPQPFNRESESMSDRLNDAKFMARAIQLAKQGKYTTDPNPSVGCVIAREDKTIAEGWHRRAGEGHAEVNALADAGEKARGATAYVTLEPCSHYGRTGPCAVALAEAGVSRVVIAMQDPNPKVSGKGIEILENAGISVSCGLLEDEARALNPGFISRMARKRPTVRIKLAMSLDGRTAMASGQSKWITGAAARADVQAQRLESSVVLTGSGTVLADNPSLTVRESDWPSMPAEAKQYPRQPKRAVLDWHCRLSGQEKIFQGDGEVIHFSLSDVSVEKYFSENGATAVVSAVAMKERSLEQVLAYLAEDEVNSVLVEAGPTLAGEFIRQGLWDECVIYVAPKLMGSSALPLFGLGLDYLEDAVQLELADVRQFGDDLRLSYRPRV